MHGFWLSVPKRKLTEAWQIRKTVDRNLVEWFHINNFDSVSDGLAFFLTPICAEPCAWSSFFCLVLNRPLPFFSKPATSPEKDYNLLFDIHCYHVTCGFLTTLADGLSHGPFACVLLCGALESQVKHVQSNSWFTAWSSQIC